MKIRQTISRLREWRSRRSVNVEKLREELSPVFIVGGNRSGTGMVSSILSQHPELEGIYSGETESTYDDEGHSHGFCESFHLWKFLFESGRDTRSENAQLPFWSLPQYLALFYRHRPKDKNEIFEIVWDLQRHRTTERQPLIKNQYVTLMIGLFTSVFPRARFILITRPWQDFIQSGIHKWTHDGGGTLFHLRHPRVGLHWHLVNLIARYDLETYAPGRYAELWLDVLHQGPEAAQEAFQKALSTISLQPFEFDLSVLEPQWSKRKNSQSAPDRARLDVVRAVVEFERQVLARMNSHPQIRS
ncbi:MAG: sulfotransferase [Deltaproteobacteria bacterium]|nr:sulfotransferase [Deltaproteobacteria bacterium]